MTFNNLLALLGGLALFLYGMHMMSAGLEQAAGDRMKAILEKLTSNPFLGVIVGAVITAIIQSSSATTVMVVGFVNSQLMTLNQAVWLSLIHIYVRQIQLHREYLRFLVLCRYLITRTVLRNLHDVWYGSQSFHPLLFQRR